MNGQDYSDVIEFELDKTSALRTSENYNCDTFEL